MVEVKLIFFVIDVYIYNMHFEEGEEQWLSVEKRNSNVLSTHVHDKKPVVFRGRKKNDNVRA